MLAQLGSRDDLVKKGFVYEPKLDGTRAICYYDGKAHKLINRRGRDITYRYPEFDFSKHINAKSCVLDGEVVVYDKKGNPSFRLLQKREQIDKPFLIEARSREIPATYVVFDILEKEGKKLWKKPLSERRAVLEKTVGDGPGMQTIFQTKEGPRLWKAIAKRDVEGVMAKRADGPYRPGARSRDWIKVKNLKTIDCVIIGYRQEKRVISSLALGLYEGGKKGVKGKKLVYVGKVGTGFTERSLKDLYEKLEKIEIEKGAAEMPDYIHPVKPKLVCEVRYLEMSRDRKLRAPAFMRLRDDKAPSDCIFGQ